MKSSYQAQHIESPTGELGIHEFLACVYDAIRSLLQARRLQRSTRMGWGVDTPTCRPCGRRRWIARPWFQRRSPPLLRSIHACSDDREFQRRILAAIRITSSRRSAAGWICNVEEALAVTAGGCCGSFQLAVSDRSVDIQWCCSAQGLCFCLEGGEGGLAPRTRAE